MVWNLTWFTLGAKPKYDKNKPYEEFVHIIYYNFFSCKRLCFFHCLILQTHRSLVSRCYGLSRTLVFFAHMALTNVIIANKHAYIHISIYVLQQLPLSVLLMLLSAYRYSLRSYFLSTIISTQLCLLCFGYSLWW